MEDKKGGGKDWHVVKQNSTELGKNEGKKPQAGK